MIVLVALLWEETANFILSFTIDKKKRHAFMSPSIMEAKWPRQIMILQMPNTITPHNPRMS